MDNIFKMSWDYTGGKKLGSELQEDWNCTLITAINMVSRQIHDATLRGGANTIIMNKDIFNDIIKDIPFTSIDDNGVLSLSYRYKIVIDSSLSNIIRVFCDDKKIQENSLGEITIENYVSNI